MSTFQLRVQFEFLLSFFRQQAFRPMGPSNNLFWLILQARNGTMACMLMAVLLVASYQLAPAHAAPPAPVPELAPGETAPVQTAPVQTAPAAALSNSIFQHLAAPAAARHSGTAISILSAGEEAEAPAEEESALAPR